MVVGADRIAANGDTANKIGTYQLVSPQPMQSYLLVMAFSLYPIGVDVWEQYMEPY